MPFLQSRPTFDRPYRGKVGGEAAQQLQCLVDGSTRGRYVDRAVQALFHLRHLRGEPASGGCEAEGDLAAVDGAGLLIDEVHSDESVDQSAGAATGLANQQVAEPGQGQRLMVGQYAQNLGLGWSQSQWS